MSPASGAKRAAREGNLGESVPTRPRGPETAKGAEPAGERAAAVLPPTGIAGSPAESRQTA